MKLSLVSSRSFATVAAFALLAVGCTSEDAPLKKAPPPETTPAETTPAPAPRKLVEGKVLPTSAVNLLTDPGFGLVGQETGFGSFIAVHEGDFSQVDMTTSFDSRSPAGFAGNVAVIHPAGATNTASESVMLLASFQGGEGPFRAQVWVSRTSISGAPLELTTDENGVHATVTDGTPDGEAFDLPPAEGMTRTSGGRTWVLFRGEVPKALPFGGFFVLRTGTAGGKFLVAAPEVVAQPLEAAVVATTKSLGSAAALRARSKTSAEKTAIARYRAIPPRLMPVSPSARRAD